VVESAAALSDGPYIELTDLPQAFQEGGKDGLQAMSFTNLTYEQASNEFEKYYFRTQLLLANGDTKVAAERAQVSEKSVYRRRKEFGLDSTT
jgi:DNA-binding NtrC family response regulator